MKHGAKVLFGAAFQQMQLMIWSGLMVFSLEILADTYQYAIASGRHMIGPRFILQQDNSKHTAKFIKNSFILVFTVFFHKCLKLLLSNILYTQ